MVTTWERPPILEQVRSYLPSCLYPPGNFEQFSPAAPKKEVLAGMLIGAGRGGWALSIELGRYCLVKGGLTMEPYLGPLLTPSNPRSFVKAAIVEVPHTTRGRVNLGFPHSLISDGSVVDVGGEHVSKKA